MAFGWEELDVLDERPDVHRLAPGARDRKRRLSEEGRDARRMLPQRVEGELLQRCEELRIELPPLGIHPRRVLAQLDALRQRRRALRKAIEAPDAEVRRQASIQAPRSILRVELVGRFEIEE